MTAKEDMAINMLENIGVIKIPNFKKTPAAIGIAIILYANAIFKFSNFRIFS